ncbi:MAG: hypothetical protein SCARUB_00380 [Candidatus Scalindua rubra]|uniref:Uncharacterized protein n=1 Tax=Candidatus Scalindua rubra TaxID=1872076 RepID=A0A1E3XHW2_9BACT|nr:MAG: hypothetical protein SCARUB_00380 [Candidatus Scalindua rubra]
MPFIAEGLFSTIANNKEAIKELKQIRKTYKIYSKILDDYLWIVANGKELQELVTEGVKDVIYTQEEVSRMIDECVSKEGLKVIHKVKKSFTGATVENIENEQDKI